MQSTPASTAPPSSPLSSSSQLDSSCLQLDSSCPQLDNWYNVFVDNTRETYDEEAFTKFKVRNKLSDEYEKERQDLLKLCGRSQWKRHSQPGCSNDQVEVAIIGKWNKHQHPARDMQLFRGSSSPASQQRSPPWSSASSSSTGSSEEDDTQSTTKTIIVDNSQPPYHVMQNLQDSKQEQQVRLTKDSYYVALMRILPNGFKEEQVCPSGVEIQFHILYGKAIFHYEDRCQPYHKGQTIKLKPKMSYKIHNPRPDQYTYLIYLLKVISSSCSPNK